MRLIELAIAGLLLLLLLMVLAVPIWIALMFAVWRFVLPWAFVAFVAWMLIGGMGRGSRPRRRSFDRWQPRPMPMPRGPFSSQSQAKPEPRPEPPPTMTPKPAPVAPKPTPELPIGVQIKVEQIRRKVEVLLTYASRFPPFSQDLFLVRQTASEYLPRTIDAYLALPEGEGDRVITANGKTALQELKEQLDLLDGKLDEIAEDLQQRNVDHLLANRRFLEERFGRTAS